MIKVLVVEDSPVAKEYLVHVLSSDPGIAVVGTASDGREAVEAAGSMRPDVITMDINMPVMDGLEATRRIMETNPVPIVIVSGAWNPAEVKTTFKAMEAGALAIVQRPVGFGHPDAEKMAGEIILKVKLMSEVKVVRRWARQQAAGPQADVPRSRSDVPTDAADIDIVAIGASTGGPAVIRTILSSLPKDFPVPVVVVQHIAAGFLSGMVNWLAETSGIPVEIAADGELLLPGRAYFAPDNFNLGVRRDGRIRLDNKAINHEPMPSVSYLFRSIADVFGRNAAGVLLSGMGKDGATEMKLLREKGAVTIAQDRETSVIFGMPGAAVELDAASYVLPPEGIIAALVTLTGTGREKPIRKDRTEILIAEDSPTQAENLRYTLERGGYSVGVARNGREALEAMERHVPAAVITDVMMPVMDGFQLCRKIKDDARFREIPVILLTALAEPGDVLKGLESGGDSFITKPYDEENLLTRVHHVLLNAELRKTSKTDSKTEIFFRGEKYHISSDRNQILDLLLSTYETAVMKNHELKEAQEKLKAMNDKLQTEIAERRRREEEVRRLNEDLKRHAFQLEEANRDLESFSYSISHDLKAPLRSIGGFSHILTEEYSGRLEGEGRHLLVSIGRNAKKMSMMIDDILAFSRAANHEVEMRIFSAEKIVRKVIDELAPSFAGRTVRFELRELPRSMGDAAVVHQVFLNLLSNAIKFTRSKEEARIEIGGKVEGEEVIYYVRDNGVGFDAGYGGKLFGLFQRLHSSADFEGTGIGLAIVKRFVNKLHGRVWAEGKINEGATFYFTLPTAPG